MHKHIMMTDSIQGYDVIVSFNPNYNPYLVDKYGDQVYRNGRSVLEEDEKPLDLCVYQMTLRPKEDGFVVSKSLYSLYSSKLEECYDSLVEELRAKYLHYQIKEHTEVQLNA